VSDEESAGEVVPPDGPVGRGVVRYFRDCPDRFFAVLGGIVFVAGWAGSIYLALFADYGPTGGAETPYRIQVMVSLGASVTTASAVLWAVAAYLWIHLLPDGAEAPV
jgi:hypothetical protein